MVSLHMMMGGGGQHQMQMQMQMEGMPVQWPGGGMYYPPMGYAGLGYGYPPVMTLQVLQNMNITMLSS